MAYMFHNNLPGPYRTRSPGIYAIVNRNNHKLYIGSAANLSHRWASHRHDFFKNRQNPYLMRAFQKEPEAFYFEVVEELPGASKIHRLEREQFWMDFYRSYVPKNGYNASPEATSCEGVKHDPEFSAMLSRRFKGKKWSEEAKAHFRSVRGPHRKGWKHSAETRSKLSLARKGSKWQSSQRAKYNKWLATKPTFWNKPVIQLSMSGEFICKFVSVQDAENCLGRRSNIHSVCKGKRHHCLGFKWKYA